MVSLIIVDSDYGYYLSTGKLVAGFMVFVALVSIKWFSKWQLSVQTTKFRFEFIAFKKKIEESILYMYYL